MNAEVRAWRECVLRSDYVDMLEAYPGRYVILHRRIAYSDDIQEHTHQDFSASVHHRQSHVTTPSTRTRTHLAPEQQQRLRFATISTTYPCYLEIHANNKKKGAPKNKNQINALASHQDARPKHFDALRVPAGHAKWSVRQSINQSINQ